MIKHTIAIKGLSLLTLLILAVFLISGCTDKLVDSDSQMVPIKMETSLATGELAGVINMVCLTVSAADMETIVSCQDYDGSPLTFELDVPAGRNRLFVLQGISIDLSGPQVVYEGRSIVDIEPDATAEVDIVVEPVVPLIKVTPREIAVLSGESFEVDVLLYAMPALRETELRVNYNTDLLTADSVVLGSTASHAGSVFTIDPAMEMPIQMLVSDIDITTGSIVDADGYSELATIYFTSNITFDSGVSEIEVVPGLFTTNDGSVITAADVFSLASTVSVGRYSQPLMRFTPAHQIVPSFDPFQVDVEVFNCTDLSEIDFRMLYNDTVMWIDSVTKGLSLDDYDALIVSIGDVQVPGIGVIDTAGGTIVDSDGYAHLATVYFSTTINDSMVAATITPAPDTFITSSAGFIPVTDVVLEHATLSIEQFDDYEVIFPDPGLLSLIQGATGVSTGPILRSDVMFLTSLDAMNGEYEIADLTGINELISLTYLDMDFNSISDLSPLSGLRYLHTLYLKENLITDISALSSLVNVMVLDLSNGGEASGNSITDLTPLANMTQLTNLDISWNYNLADLSGLEGLTNLNMLSLDYNAITDIAPLVTNSNSGGLGTGDVISLYGNALSAASCSAIKDVLETNGATVSSDCGV